MFEPAQTPERPFGATTRQLLHRRELAVERFRAATARRLGISDREMLAVAHLAQRGTLAPSELGSLLGLSSAGTTAMTQRLEAAGHVDRVPHPSDGRSSLLRLSADIVARAEEAFRPLVAELELIAEEVPERDRAAVERFLVRVAVAGEEHAERALRELGPRGGDRPTLPLPGLWA